MLKAVPIKSSSEKAFADSGDSELGEITENIESVPHCIPMHRAVLQDTSALNALSTDSTDALTRGTENGRSKGK